MTFASLSCPKPIRKAIAFTQRDYDLRDIAIESFTAGDYETALLQSLKFALPTAPIDQLKKGELTVVQGTARIKLRLANKRFSVYSEIARIGQSGNATASLRHMLTQIGSTGQFYQPRLTSVDHETIVRLGFEEAIDILHPVKTIEAVEKLVFEADRNDHWMAARFEIAAGDREPPVALSAKELAQAEAIWQTHWDEIEGLLNEVRRRRSTMLLEATCSLASRHIQYLLPLYGEVRRELQEEEMIFEDEQEIPDKRVQAVARCIKVMRGISKETLHQCIGHMHYTAPPLSLGHPALVTSVFHADFWSAISNARANGRTIEAAMAMLGALLHLVTRYQWEPEFVKMLRKAIDAIHQKPWRVVVEELYPFIAELRQQFAQADEEMMQGAE
jgi:hypothetical protein